jgi:hypothetical protein
MQTTVINLVLMSAPPGVKQSLSYNTQDGTTLRFIPYECLRRIYNKVYLMQILYHYYYYYYYVFGFIRKINKVRPHSEGYSLPLFKILGNLK